MSENLLLKARFSIDKNLYACFSMKIGRKRFERIKNKSELMKKQYDYILFDLDSNEMTCRHTSEQVDTTTKNIVVGTMWVGSDDIIVSGNFQYTIEGKTPYQVDFEYIYDLQSFFEFFSVFNVTEVARRAGINPTLMRQYTSGVKKAGEKTYAKLSSCINDIRKDIIAASF